MKAQLTSLTTWRPITSTIKKEEYFLHLESEKKSKKAPS